MVKEKNREIEYELEVIIKNYQDLRKHDPDRVKRALESIEEYTGLSNLPDYLALAAEKNFDDIFEAVLPKILKEAPKGELNSTLITAARIAQGNNNTNMVSALLPHITDQQFLATELVKAAENEGIKTVNNLSPKITNPDILYDKLIDLIKHNPNSKAIGIFLGKVKDIAPGDRDEWKTYKTLEGILATENAEKALQDLLPQISDQDYLGALARAAINAKKPDIATILVNKLTDKTAVPDGPLKGNLPLSEFYSKTKERYAIRSVIDAAIKGEIRTSNIPEVLRKMDTYKPVLVDGDADLKKAIEEAIKHNHKLMFNYILKEIEGRGNDDASVLDFAAKETIKYGRENMLKALDPYMSQETLISQLEKAQKTNAPEKVKSLLPRITSLESLGQALANSVNSGNKELFDLLFTKMKSISPDGLNTHIDVAAERAIKPGCEQMLEALLPYTNNQVALTHGFKTAIGNNDLVKANELLGRINDQERLVEAFSFTPKSSEIANKIYDKITDEYINNNAYKIALIEDEESRDKLLRRAKHVALDNGLRSAMEHYNPKAFSVLFPMVENLQNDKIFKMLTLDAILSYQVRHNRIDMLDIVLSSKKINQDDIVYAFEIGISSGASKETINKLLPKIDSENLPKLLAKAISKKSTVISDIIEKRINQEKPPTYFEAAVNTLGNFWQNIKLPTLPGADAASIPSRSTSIALGTQGSLPGTGSSKNVANSEKATSAKAAGLYENAMLLENLVQGARMLGEHIKYNTGPFAEQKDLSKLQKLADTLIARRPEIAEDLAKYEKIVSDNEPQLEKERMRLDLIENPNKIDSMIRKIDAEIKRDIDTYGQETQNYSVMKQELAGLKNPKNKEKIKKQIEKNIQSMESETAEYQKLKRISDNIFDIEYARERFSTPGVRQSYLDDAKKVISDTNTLIALKAAVGSLKKAFNPEKTVSAKRRERRKKEATRA